jgi:hypothetical protein
VDRLGPESNGGPVVQRFEALLEAQRGVYVEAVLTVVYGSLLSFVREAEAEMAANEKAKEADGARVSTRSKAEVDSHLVSRAIVLLRLLCSCWWLLRGAWVLLG